MPPSSIKKQAPRKATEDINSNSVLEINNIMDSDGKPDDDEPTPMHSKGKSSFKTKKGSNASKGLMLIKEEKQMKDSTTQYTPRPEAKKTQKRDVGVSVEIPKENNHKKAHTVSVSCATELTMNSKELASLNASTALDSRRRKASKQSSKGARSGLEEFQDIEIVHNKYDFKHFQKNKSKRQKSNEKQKKMKGKGSSYDSLRPNAKIGTSTPEWFLNIKDERRNINTLNPQDESPKSKRRVRRSMDHYHHPDFDNYLLHQTHYYHSLNAFPKGSKFKKGKLTSLKQF